MLIEAELIGDLARDGFGIAGQHDEADAHRTDFTQRTTRLFADAIAKSQDRGDLAIDSLSLVSLAIRLGEEFGVDIVESGVEFSQLRTVGDLMVIAEKLQVRD